MEAKELMVGDLFCEWNNDHEQFGRIKTIGQFKMFLTLCGVQDFVKQLK